MKIARSPYRMEERQRKLEPGIALTWITEKKIWPCGWRIHQKWRFSTEGSPPYREIIRKPGAKRVNSVGRKMEIGRNSEWCFLFLNSSRNCSCWNTASQRSEGLPGYWRERTELRKAGGDATNRLVSSCPLGWTCPLRLWDSCGLREHSLFSVGFLLPSSSSVCLPGQIFLSWGRFHLSYAGKPSLQRTGGSWLRPSYAHL